MSFTPRALSLLALLLVAWLARPGAVPAQTSTEQELAELAKSIKNVLLGRDETSVNLVTFASLDPIPSNAGPALYRGLRDELTRAGVKIDPGARFTVKGAYRAGMHKVTKKLLLQLVVQVVDRSDKALVKFNRAVVGEAAVLEAVAPTVALSIGDSEMEREEAIARSITKPTAHLNGSAVSANADSPYAVAVLVKAGRDYKPRAPRLVKGLAYVLLKREDVYAVRLMNNSAHEAAVTLTIDGLHAFSFSTVKDRAGRPRRLSFLVPAKGTVVVKGWPISLGKSEEFLVTSYGGSASKELGGDPAKVGVISASFRASWPRGGTPPTDEKERARDAATGRGAEIKTPLKAVERVFGERRATISVRYTR